MSWIRGIGFTHSESGMNGFLIGPPMVRRPNILTFNTATSSSPTSLIDERWIPGHSSSYHTTLLCGWRQSLQPSRPPVCGWLHSNCWQGCGGCLSNLEISSTSQCRFINPWFQTQGLSGSRVWVLEHGHIFISNRLFLIRPWHQDLEKELEELRTFPVWMTMKNIPLYLWNRIGIHY